MRGHTSSKFRLRAHGKTLSTGPTARLCMPGHGIMVSPIHIGPYECSRRTGGLATLKLQVTQPLGDPREVRSGIFYVPVPAPLVAISEGLVIPPRGASEGSDEDRSATFSLLSRWMNSQMCGILLCDEFSAAAYRCDVVRGRNLGLCLRTARL